MPIDAGPGSLAEQIGSRSSGLAMGMRVQTSAWRSDRIMLVYNWTFTEHARRYSMQRLCQLSTARVTRGIQMIKLTTLTLLFWSDI